MKILELNIIEFGGLKERKIVPQEGLNLLVGDNESGKSTVLLFIKFMLYGMPKRRQEERVRAVSRDGHCAKGSMTVACGEEEYRIERSFTEGTRSGTERVHCYRLRDGAEVLVGEVPGEALLGVTREIAESTCCIGQMQCRNMGEKKGVEAIRNLLSSADEAVDVTKIEAKLNEVRKTYRLKKGEGGRLYDLQQRRHALQQQYETALKTGQRIAELTACLDREGKLAEQQRIKLEQLDALFVQLGNRARLRQFDLLRKRKQERQQLEQMRQAQAEQSFPGGAAPTDADAMQLRRLAETWQETCRQAEHAKQTAERLGAQKNGDPVLAEHARQLEEAGGRGVLLQQWRDLARQRKSGTAMLGLGIALAILVGVLAVVTVLPAVLAALLPLALAGFGCGRRLRAEKSRRAMACRYGQTDETLEAYWETCASVAEQDRAIDKELIRANTEWEVAERTRKETCLRMEQLLQNFACTVPMTAEAIGAEATRWESYLQSDHRAEQRIGVLTQTIAEEEAALANDREEELRATVPPEVVAMSEQDMREVERNKAYLTEQQRALHDTISRQRVELASLQANFVSPMVLADELSALQEKLARGEEYCAALELAMDALQEASQVMSGSITPALNRTAGEIMADMSDGVYTRLHSGTDLSPSLTGADGLTVPGEMMSGGTADAAYLALRIALMKQVFGGEMPPLMLDDALCQLDDGRVCRVLKWLARQCQTAPMQCLLFTCHRREAELCEQMDLPYHRIAMAPQTHARNGQN